MSIPELNVRFEGEKEVQRKIKLLMKKNPEALRKAILKSVIVVEGKAKEKAPVLTGRLRSSITHVVSGQDPSTTNFGGKVTTRLKASDKKGAIEGIVGTGVGYAPYLEFGTAKQPAQPYLYPALVESRGKIIKFLKQAIKAIRI